MIYKNGIFLREENELKNKEYYLSLFSENKIDTQKIYSLTAKINNNLHFKFGIKNLYHRMIFTACALVAKRYGSVFSKGMPFETFHTDIKSTLNKSFADAIKINQKLNILLEIYAIIKMNMTENQDAIDEFIESVTIISDNLNSDFWNGEDVMAIFFNEFNRYKGKSEQGQVFTPDHITSLMYRLIGVNKDDIVLDAACGSGAFLVKAMCNMIKDAGGMSTNKAREIKQKQLYGIEFDREIYALACANFLIHKDGKTNLEQLDSRSEEAKKWMQSRRITKVLMNPPFENKYGCLDIVLNVLDSVERETLCAFIMPDNKLETNLSKAKKILQKHCLTKIIKLPSEIFSGVTTSIFIFKASVPQNNAQIFACHISEDGLETVKNQGRQNTKDKWEDIENYWVDVIYKQSGDKSIQWLDASKNLSYKTPEAPFHINEQNFKKSVLDYILFEKQASEQDFKKTILDYVLYGSEIKIKESILNHIKSNNKQESIDISKWGRFPLSDLFIISGSKTTPKNKLELDDNKAYPYVTTQATNNGIYSYSDKWTEQGGVLVVDSAVLGTCTYQKDNFTASDHVEKLTPKFAITRNIALYISTVINKAGEILGYSYAKKRSQRAMEKEYIFLPVNKNGNPDWLYMENFITKVYEEQQKIVHL